MLDLVGVRFHRTSRSFWGQYGRSRKNLMFGLFQVASCPSEPWTSDNEHQKVASVICPPSPVDASWCLKNSSGWLPVQIHASGILSTQILSKHPLSILISLIWYLDVLFFFSGDASHIILCCIPYHPHLTNKKLTKSRCPVAMHVAKPGDKKKFRIFDSRQQILIIPCRQNLSTWELESREIEREVTKACRWYGHSVVPLHQSLPTQRGTSEPQLTAAATCRNDCKKRNQASWNGS